MTTKAFCIMLVKDEIDVIEHTLRHLLSQELDGILIADNNSHDGTRELLWEASVREKDTPVHLLFDDEFAWYQQAKMTELARLAHEYGANWIVPCDADEWWRVNDGRTLGAYLRTRTEPVIVTPTFNYFASGLDSPNEANPYRRIAWRRPPERLPKVAFQWQANTKLSDGNHALLNADDSHVRGNLAELEMRHLCHRSEDHFVSAIVNGGKALAGTNYPEDRGGHWRVYWKHYLANGEQGLRDWWKANFYFPNPQEAGLIHDPIAQDAT